MILAAKHSANPDLLSKDSAQLVPQSGKFTTLIISIAVLNYIVIQTKRLFKFCTNCCHHERTERWKSDA